MEERARILMELRDFGRELGIAIARQGEADGKAYLADQGYGALHEIPLDQLSHMQPFRMEDVR